MTQPREALAPEVVEAARKALVINQQDALAELNKFDPSFIPTLISAVQEAETNIKLRSALNRILFTNRNQTFAIQCRIELAKWKEKNGEEK